MWIALQWLGVFVKSKQFKPMSAIVKAWPGNYHSDVKWNFYDFCLKNKETSEVDQLEDAVAASLTFIQCLIGLMTDMQVKNEPVCCKS